MVFTKYQKMIIAILATLQFSVILDFMILSPLGAILMPALQITPAQFGLVVSVYAFSAGAAGILSAGFADRFDRKKMLLFFYTGFIIGTLMCGMAPNYHALLVARIITGLFGGVLGSVVSAITTDLFPLEVRGRVMGIVQTAFSVTQVAGLPLCLYLANIGNWHTPFQFIVVLGIITTLIIIKFVDPINDHLHHKTERNPFKHLHSIVTNPSYLKAFGAVVLISTGGFMLMPFGSAFLINNLGVDIEHLPTIYIFTGLSSIILGPQIGKLSDRIGKYKIFLFGSLLTSIMVLIYTNMGRSPFSIVVLVNVFLWIGITARIISSHALLSAVPDAKNRGAFMSVSSSTQQISGGVASIIAGSIVIVQTNGQLEHFNTVGYVVVGATAITLLMMYRIHLDIQQKAKESSTGA